MMPTHEILANHKAPALAIENNLFRLGLLSSFRVDSGVCMVRIWSKRRATGGEIDAFRDGLRKLYGRAWPARLDHLILK